MAQQFIGVEVMILLKAAPPNPQLEIHGLVAGVAGQQLTLHNGTSEQEFLIFERGLY